MREFFQHFIFALHGLVNDACKYLYKETPEMKRNIAVSIGHVLGHIDYLCERIALDVSLICEMRSKTKEELRSKK